MIDNLTHALRLAQIELDKALPETNMIAAIGHLQMLKVYCEIATTAADSLIKEMTPNDAKE